MDASFDLPIPHPRSCPTADEVIFYKARITSINEQIDETQNQVLELERKRSNYASYISPLRCLPTEILGQIIHLCLNHGVDLATLIQICGTVRDVAIRMTKIWNRIRVGGFSRVYSKKYGISCRNREQLDFVLSCAGSTPLELYLDGVVEPQLVEAISSVNYPIESLTIDNPRPQTIKFANLNMRELKRLYFKGMEYNDIKELMDVAIQSVNKEMSLGMGLWRRGTPLALQHPLLLRVVDLSLSSELNEFSGPFNLPRLRSLDIKGRPALFSAFDLRNVRTLSIKRFNPAQLSKFPAQLNELTLEIGAFRSTDQIDPCCFPNLEKLKLHNVDVEGPLQNWVRFPRLKCLELDYVMFPPSDGHNWRYVQGREEDEQPLHWDMLFDPDIPDLEVLFFSWFSVDEEFAGRLQLLTRLRSLKTSFLISDGFISSFLERLSDSKYLPSLMRLDLEGQQDLQMPYEEFVELCSTKRSRLEIYGTRFIK